MVNVDELNEYIKKFGSATNKLNEISAVCEDFKKTAALVDETNNKQEKLQEILKSDMSAQKEWLDVTLRNTESHISDKIELQDKIIKESEKNVTGLVKSQEKKMVDMEQHMFDRIHELENELVSARKMQRIMIAGIVLSMLLTVVMHFV